MENAISSGGIALNCLAPVRCRKGFTLVELIVVIVIMSILAGFSAMAYRGIAADLRMSSAINTVTSALDNARAEAIKHNRYVITVFHPRLDRDGTEQVIDIVVGFCTVVNKLDISSIAVL